MGSTSFATRRETCWISLYANFRRVDIAEGAEELSLGGPICDGEYDAGKCSSEVVLESLPEIDGCPVRVVAGSAAAPCAENEHEIAEHLRDREHAMHPVSGIAVARSGACRST